MNQLMEKGKKTSKTHMAFILGVGRVVVIILSMGMAVVLSRIMAKDEYGSFRQILYVYSSFLILFQVGFPRATSFFLPRVSLGAGKTVLIKILLIFFLIGITFSLFLYFGAGPISRALNNFKLVKLLKHYSPIPLLVLPTFALEGACLTFSNVGSLVFFQVLSKGMSFLAVCLPICMGYSLAVAIDWWCFAAFLSLCISFKIMFAPYKGVRAEPSDIGIKKIFKFGGLLGVSSLLGAVLVGADKFFVSRCYGVNVFAEYINGAFEFPIIGIIVGSSTSVLVPFFSRLQNEHVSKAEIVDKWGNAIRKNAILLYPLLVAGYFLGKEIILLLYSNRYSASIIIFRIYILVGFLRVVLFGPLMIGIGALRQYAFAHLVGVISVVLFCWAVALLGLSPGWLAISYVFSSFLVGLVCFWGIVNKLSVPIINLLPYRDMGNIFIISIISGILVFVGVFPDRGESGQGGILRVVAGGSLFFMVYYLLIRRNERLKKCIFSLKPQIPHLFKARS